MASADFWRQKPGTITSAAKTEPQPDSTVVEKTAVKVLKRPDWADSSEDEEFDKKWSIRHDSQQISREAEVLQKDSEINALEASIVAKDVQIKELKDLAQRRLLQISELEAHLKELSENDIQQKLKLDESDLYIKELTAEVDEKDRRVAQLETELEKKAAIICSLENESGAHTHVSANNKETEQAKAAEPPHSQDQASQSIIEQPLEIPNITTLKVIETAGSGPRDLPQDSVAESLGASQNTLEPSEAEPKVPTFGNSEFPVFATRETVKAGPPVPKPKTLKFPMDMSKYGKKAIQKPATNETAAEQPAAKGPVANQQQEVAGKRALTPTSDVSRRHPCVSEALPKFNPSLDIRRMNIHERRVYGKGLRVSVKMGATELDIVPKYVLMQCSQKAHGYFTAHPDSTSITYPANSMNIDAAKAHLQWMREMTYQHRVWSITLNGDVQYDEKNLNICRAARVLGLNNMFVGHFTRQFCDRLRQNQTTPALLKMICDLHFPENDPVFDCLAGIIFNRYTKKETKMPQEFAELVAAYPALKASIEKRVTATPKDQSPGFRTRGRGHDRNKSSASHKSSGSNQKAGPR